MYKYFISFCYEETHPSIGLGLNRTSDNLLLSNTEVDLDFLIKNFDEIKMVEEKIKEKLKFNSCKIIFYTLLSETF
jgi:hypothetical protein